MKRGRPAKRKKGNISGLKNQKVSPIPSPSPSHDSSPASGSTSPAPSARPNPIVPDSTRTNWEEEDMAPLDSDLDDQMELDIWDDEDLAEELEKMLRKAEAASECLTSSNDGVGVNFGTLDSSIIKIFP